VKVPRPTQLDEGRERHFQRASVAGDLLGEWLELRTGHRQDFGPDGQNIKKPAACFARRVKRATQKYIYFRKSEIMI
jgi:hypothetical protein